MGSAWHRGVIGILASRVVDKTGRPALVITHEDGLAYGSGRSVSGFHLLDALTAVDGEGEERLFARFGGHAHAVGFSLASGRVGELRERMVRYAAERQDAGEVVEEVGCDAEVRLGDLTEEFLAALEQMGPFGTGNAEPVFVSSRGEAVGGAEGDQGAASARDGGGRCGWEELWGHGVEPEDGLGGDGGAGWVVARRPDGPCVSTAQELASDVWRMGVGDCGNPTHRRQPAHDADVI